MANLKHIVVYGSLRVGQTSERLMKSCEYVGCDRIDGALYTVGWYPGVVADAEDDEGVVVDVFKLPEGEMERALLFATLDQYEGFEEGNPDSLFTREVTTTREGRLPAYVYYFNRPVKDYPRIKGGNWNVEHPIPSDRVA